MNLLELVRHYTGSDIVSIDTMTPVVLLGGKKNPMQGRVTKFVQGSNVILFSNHRVNSYFQMVQKRLGQEGKEQTFELSERRWGTRVANYPIVKHIKDEIEQYYLECIFIRSGKVTYYLDGNIIEKNDIEGLNEPNKPEQGGLENTVILRDYKIENIVRIKVAGNDYEGPFYVENL